MPDSLREMYLTEAEIDLVVMHRKANSRCKTDESIGFNEKGEKLYQVDGYDRAQCLGYGFRIVLDKDKGTIRFQKQYTGESRGEATQMIWADIPVVDVNGNFGGYEIGINT